MLIYFQTETATCIKGLSWPPLRQKEMFYTYFLFIRILALGYNSGINLTFTVAMVTKMKLG